VSVLRGKRRAAVPQACEAGPQLKRRSVGLIHDGRQSMVLGAITPNEASPQTDEM